MIHHDSRYIQPGDTYICLPGGEKYIDQAKINGARKVLKMNREEMAQLANETFDTPSRRCKVIGVTGTNGKTTVCHIVADALNQAGFNAKYQGTLSGNLTTPESIITQQAIAEHIQNGGTHFVMEVSSHAIDQGRILGIHFDVKCLTNITQDHLDYHKTFAHYKQTKLNFMGLPGKSIYPETFESIPITFPHPLLGQFNHENMQAAVAILKQYITDKAQLEAILKTVKAPPGRFESINEGQPFYVIVDYAHTPDGLQKVLQEGQHLSQKSAGKLITVFGCGGERDRGKRPIMGKIAQQFSHHVILTQDNPRGEDPDQIIADITAGFSPTSDAELTTQPDRKKAIYHAIEIAKANDVVIIAGKGHETQQILKDRSIFHDDRQVCREALLEKRDRTPF